MDFWSAGHPAASGPAFPAAERLRRSVLELPVHQGLGPAEMDRIAAAVRQQVESGVHRAARAAAEVAAGATGC